MKVSEAIKKRRSVRKFDSGKEVTDKQVEKLLEAAQWAPSAGNLQSWYFVVVENQEVKEKLVAEAWVQELILEAPIIIVVCSDPERTFSRYKERGGRYALQDTAIAAQNIWLMATEMGLGTCFLAAFDDRAVTRILNLTSSQHPIAIMPIGYPAESPEPPPRRPIREISRNI